MTDPLATLRHVTYAYPGADRPALVDVDLDVRPGLTLVAGDSGSGKSTLLRLFNGLVPQFHGGRIAGSAEVLGLDPMRAPIPRLAVGAGLVFQDVETQSVYGTVEREVAFGLENLGRPRAEMHDRVEEALAELGIESLRRRRLTTLSGGDSGELKLLTGLDDKRIKSLLLSSDLPDELPDVDIKGLTQGKSDFIVLQFTNKSEVALFKNNLGLPDDYARVIPVEVLLEKLEWKTPPSKTPPTAPHRKCVRPVNK